MHLYASIIWIITFILNTAHSNTNHKSNPSTIHYTSYHIEWSNPSQWATTTHDDNTDLISCNIQMPSLCIYAVFNAPGFRVFYNESMFDFLNDDHWSTINIIRIIGDDPPTILHPNDAKNTKPKPTSHMRRLLQKNKELRELAAVEKIGDLEKARERGSGRGRGSDRRSRAGRAAKRMKRGADRAGRKVARNLKRLAKSKTAKRLFMAWLATRGVKALMGGGRGGGLSRLLGGGRYRRVPGSYGCFNALCTTVLGPPRIIGPPVPGGGLARGAAHGLGRLAHGLSRFAEHIGPFSRCHSCGNHHYPGYMFMGPSSGMMGGMMYPMMGGMGGMMGTHPMMGGMGGMMAHPMGGMGMGMGHPMGGMGMGMGMHPHQMGGMGMMGHPMGGMGMHPHQMGMHPNQMGMGAHHASGTSSTEINYGAQNPLHVVVHEEKDRRRLKENVRDKEVKDIMREFEDLVHNEYKIIQKCIAMKDKDICVTYSYFDGTVTVDYHIAKEMWLRDGENGKYYSTSAWVWHKDGMHCNGKLLGNEGGSVCVEYIDSDVVVTVNRVGDIDKLRFDLDSIAETCSEVYDVEFASDDKAFHKKKLCQNMSIGSARDVKMCIETLDNTRDIEEMQISVERMIDDDNA